MVGDWVGLANPAYQVVGLRVTNDYRHNLYHRPRRELGSIECDPNNASTVTIRAIGGTVHFADIDIVEIVEKSPAE